MRKFLLQNGKGAQFDLMRKDAFLCEPEGLGFGTDLSLSQVGPSWVLTQSTQQRPEPSGQMVFAGYGAYDEFTNFVAAGGLKLGYKTVGAWIWLPCMISLEKGEIGTNRRLCCDITFHGLGPWAEQTYFSQGGLAAYGTRYPMHYSYSYGSGNPGVILIAGGRKDSPFCLHLFGPAVNPAWSVYQYGEVVGTGRVITTLLAGRKLVINSDPAKMEIAEYTVDGKFVASRYANSDWATDRMILLPAGECRIRTSDDNGVIKGIVEVQRLV